MADAGGPGMAVVARTIRLADGRVLDVREAGPPGDLALLHIEGTPSGATTYPPDVEAALARGLRYVLYARPGYGSSTRQPGRSVADLVADAREVAAQLGLRRLHVVGASGGGPHALAMAALAPDLVASAATIGGVAPIEAAGLDWLDGMAQENLDEFAATRAGPGALQAFLEADAVAMATVTGPDIAAALGGLVPEVDRAALTGEFADVVAASIRDAVRNGIWGWFDDDLAFDRPWGFDLASIRIPVTVWQGSEDKMVPFAHGRWLAANVPGARPMLLEGEGHLSIAAADFGRILDDLLETPAG